LGGTPNFGPKYETPSQNSLNALELPFLHFGGSTYRNIIDVAIVQWKNELAAKQNCSYHSESHTKS
jgi:hypothetical protein